MGTQSGWGNVFADHEHGHDQIPVLASASSAVESWMPRTPVSTVGAGQALTSSGAMLDFLLATISGLDASEASFGFDGLRDAQNSLPNFLAAYATEFGLV